MRHFVVKGGRCGRVAAERREEKRREEKRGKREERSERRERSAPFLCSYWLLPGPFVGPVRWLTLALVLLTVPPSCPSGL